VQIILACNLQPTATYNLESGTYKRTLSRWKVVAKRVSFYGHFNGFGKCLEDRFNFVVFILTFTFNIKLHRAESVKDLKKWKNISVGISPIISLLKSAFHTIQLRPPKSIRTLASASSIGNANPYPFQAPLIN
jgi:hypothetical protein